MDALASWRGYWMVEGAPAIFLNCDLFILPSSRAEAGFLTSEEKDWCKPNSNASGARSRSKTDRTLQALTIFRVWHAGSSCLRRTGGVYMLSVLDAQLISRLAGISNTVVGLL